MGLLLPLLGLSLLDSTSIGTLVLPLLMVVIARQVQWAKMSVYLGTVGLLYFGIGLVLLVGADAVIRLVGDSLDSRPAWWGQLVLGVAMVALSFRLDGKEGDQGRLHRMVAGERSTRAMIGLALAAVAMEIATMVPYLGAIGLLSTSDLAFASQVGLLALYCLVMLLPALALIGAVSLAGDRLWGKMERFSGWIARQTEETVAWIVGIVGFLLAADAANRLALF